MANNPFNVMYGMIPTSIVAREDSYERIRQDFESDGVLAMAYLIEGVRGSGKTVLLRSLCRHFSSEDSWIVVNAFPGEDIISSFAEGIYNQMKAKKLISGWTLNLSLPYISFSLQGEKEKLSPKISAEQFLKKAKENGKKVLLAIDDVVSNQAMATFAAFYQAMIGMDLPFFLLMSGTYENVDALINGKASSFLSRTPKVVLEPLDQITMSLAYQKYLNCNPAQAAALAAFTKGYAFAFQVVGKICFDEKKQELDEAAKTEIDNYLASNGYNVIWNHFTEAEKQIAIALAKSKDGDVRSIRESVGMKDSNFANYRARMIQKGYLTNNGYGKIAFALPRFAKFLPRAVPEAFISH